MKKTATDKMKRMQSSVVDGPKEKMPLKVTKAISEQPELRTKYKTPSKELLDEPVKEETSSKQTSSQNSSDKSSESSQSISSTDQDNITE